MSLFFYGSAGGRSIPFLNGLRLYLDASDSTTITKAYQNLAATGSGTSAAIDIGTATIVDAVAGGDLNSTIAASTVRYYPISPVVTAGINKSKFVTNASDTAVLGYKVRNI